MHLSRNISLFWVSLQSHIFSLHILTGTDPSWNWFFMRRPLPCVPAQAVVHWRLEVKTPEFQETRQACSSPWIKGETGKGTQSGLNCSSVEKDLFLMHTVPNSPHCYLKRNTSGLGKHAEDEWLCSVTVTWGPQSQVLWEEGSGTTAENTPVHIASEGDCRRGGWNVNRCPLQTNEFKSHLI